MCLFLTGRHIPGCTLREAREASQDPNNSVKEAREASQDPNNSGIWEAERPLGTLHTQGGIYTVVHPMVHLPRSIYTVVHPGIPTRGGIYTVIHPEVYPPWEAYHCCTFSQEEGPGRPPPPVSLLGKKEGS